MDPVADPAAAVGSTAVYFDGTSNRRRVVTLVFKDGLEIYEQGVPLAIWPYDTVRRVDAPLELLRLSSQSAPSLARLEVREPATKTQVIARCRRMDDTAPGRGIGAIIGWSLAAALSIVLMVLFGVPLAADRLAPLIPASFERRLGDVAESQVKVVFDGKVCDSPQGQAAFVKLMNTLRGAAGLDLSDASAVLSSSTANAFALPGGKAFLLKGLLEKANDADEIAGVMAHELGHLAHRDTTRQMISTSGTSFLIGLLFGDITGSSVLIFAGRTVVNASYSREAEYDADTFSIDVMHRLGRSPKKMGELLFRITGKEGGTGISFLANHPFTEDRLARMTKEDRPVSGPPLLSPQEWTALKAICASTVKN
nr:M48 family metallopeptidase [Bradyrhizobium prioritasuperba]